MFLPCFETSTFYGFRLPYRTSSVFVSHVWLFSSFDRERLLFTQAVTEIVHERTYSHVQETCKGSFEVSGRTDFNLRKCAFLLNSLLFCRLTINIEAYTYYIAVFRIRDPVPFWPLDPESGISFFRIPDPNFPNHSFESLMTIFWVKSSIILWKLGQIFFFNTSKLK